jgi:hypothetical protein
VDIGPQKVLFSIGKDGILWKLDRTNGKFIALKETMYQNIYDRIDPKTGDRTYRNDVVEQEIGQWYQACPGTLGGHNWQAMSYNQPTGLLVIPLMQSCMEMQGQKIELKEGGGGSAADHGDSPGVRVDPRRDIPDVYAFQSPNQSGNVFFIMTLAPLARIVSQNNFHPRADHDFFVPGSDQEAQASFDHVAGLLVVVRVLRNHAAAM